MSEANKQTAIKFMKALCDGDVETLKSVSTKDLTAETPGTAKVCGIRSYDVIMASAAVFPLITKEGLRVEVLNVTAEGDRVALQWNGHSTMKDGKEYNNHYHNLFLFRDGKVSKMIEYCDLVLADAVLGPYLPPNG